MPVTSVYIIHLAFKTQAKATAVVSEPPLPKVVISPFSLIPWNPATITILSSFKWFNIISSEFILSITFLVCIPKFLCQLALQLDIKKFSDFIF